MTRGAVECPPQSSSCSLARSTGHARVYVGWRTRYAWIVLCKFCRFEVYAVHLMATFSNMAYYYTFFNENMGSYTYISNSSLHELLCTVNSLKFLSSIYTRNFDTKYWLF